jgi:hypothetical protein
MQTNSSRCTRKVAHAECWHARVQVEIEDMDWNEELQAFTYQCPCGDLFAITLEELAGGWSWLRTLQSIRHWDLDDGTRYRA